MNTKNIMIKAQNGSRIPYDKILSISPTRCGSEPNDFAIVAIFNTDNKAYPKDVLFRGTEEECNEWLDWFDERLSQKFPSDTINILRYPERYKWINGRRVSMEFLEEIQKKYFDLRKEYDSKRSESNVSNEGKSLFIKSRVSVSEELINAREEYLKYFPNGKNKEYLKYLSEGETNENHT